MAENRNQSREPFQFSLRTLLLTVTTYAVLCSAFRVGNFAGVFAIVLLCSVLAPVVAAWKRRETQIVDGMLLVYVVAASLFSVCFFFLRT
jgi:hypothetical protein